MTGILTTAFPTFKRSGAETAARSANRRSTFLVAPPGPATYNRPPAPRVRPPGRNRMPYQVPRLQTVPQPDDQVSFQVEGRERLRWHAEPRFPRPFFFPLVGPSGVPLTRMGHPADPTHDHHRSFWCGHHDVAGVSFWEERRDRPGGPQIRQDAWLHYQDGDTEAGMAVRLGWYDAHNVRLLQQELIAVYRPLAAGEGWLELQSTFTPALAALPIGKTNFGFLGLRVAASLSAHYGGGRLTNSEEAVGEKAVF